VRVLEIGNYVSVAYAGMILAEQGHEVTKWISGKPDPIEELDGGSDLWEWINDRKRMVVTHGNQVINLGAAVVDCGFDLIIDNVRAETWERWGVDPAREADRLMIPWVSLRDDFDGRGFDAIAQARAWGDHVGYIPVYIGDTSAGLWIAFKGLSMLAAGDYGHTVIRQAACLAKLVEGELIEVSRDGSRPPWDPPGTYGATEEGTEVHYRGEIIKEPFRSAEWRRANLQHHEGRIDV